VVRLRLSYGLLLVAVPAVEPWLQAVGVMALHTRIGSQIRPRDMRHIGRVMVADSCVTSFANDIDLTI
jgi:hypothetical protein